HSSTLRQDFLRSAHRPKVFATRQPTESPAIPRAENASLPAAQSFAELRFVQTPPLPLFRNTYIPHGAPGTPEHFVFLLARPRTRRIRPAKKALWDCWDKTDR